MSARLLRICARNLSIVLLPLSTLPADRRHTLEKLGGRFVAALWFLCRWEAPGGILVITVDKTTSARAPRKCAIWCRTRTKENMHYSQESQVEILQENNKFGSI